MATKLMILGIRGVLPAEHWEGLLGRLTGKNPGLSEPWTSISFPETLYPRLDKRGKEGLCVFVGVVRDFGINKGIVITLKSV